MMKHFLKRTHFARGLVFVLLFALIASILCGGEGQAGGSNGYYSKSEKAIAAIEDAVYVLDRCLDEKISPEECCSELSSIERKYERYCEEDDVLKLAVLGISVAGSSIRTTILKHDVGAESISGVMRAVREARDDLADKLK